METVIDYIRRISTYDWWIVAIELFFIGLVVYWAVDFLQGTRGERLFRGIIFLLVAGFIILKLIIGRLPFERLQYLYNGFLIAVLIIAVAAFQPEIRRALIRIGRPRFLAGSSHRFSKPTEEIISAVTELAATKTGSIIVIEKRVALGEFTETGVPLDAKVSAELLKTIFYPDTSLHDMAVIIRDDRIIAARVQLPLAEEGSIDGFALGSRHRAAIGITAGSDATCIVVSEETGIISIAQSGNLIRRVTESQLRNHLMVTFAGTSPIVERLRKKLKRENAV
jgi:diadenylate cyclase